MGLLLSRLQKLPDVFVTAPRKTNRTARSGTSRVQVCLFWFWSDSDTESRSDISTFHYKNKDVHFLFFCVIEMLNRALLSCTSVAFSLWRKEGSLCDIQKLFIWFKWTIRLYPSPDREVTSDSDQGQHWSEKLPRHPGGSNFFSPWFVKALHISIKLLVCAHLKPAFNTNTKYDWDDIRATRLISANRPTWRISFFNLRHIWWDSEHVLVIYWYIFCK